MASFVSFELIFRFAVSYRCFIIGGWFSHRDALSLGDDFSIMRYVSTIVYLLGKILLPLRLLFLVPLALLQLTFVLLIFIMVMEIFVSFLVSGPMLVFWFPCFGFHLGEEEEEDEDFSRYRVALERVCIQKDTAKWLWVANKSSFDHIKKCIERALEKGRNCDKLQKVIGSRLAQNTRPSEDVKALLEPLESVKMYFPLLFEDSFRRNTAYYLLIMALLIDDFISKDQHSLREVNADVYTAFEESEELMDFLDCPDNVGISLDVFNMSNLEAFVLRTTEVGRLKSMRFDFSESSTVANIVEQLCNEAENKLKVYNLLGDFNSHAVDTDWSEAAEPYVVYKICKIILDLRPTENVELLHNHLINMVADLIAMCVTESPKVLVNRSKKWAAEFREDNISAAIELSGFAW
ncbi:hypothetical protein SUGI_0091420 [Cryptomeria japonica]|nr:hypothetical protein SUGI_0091420 [Cryptomeria japonica]